MPTSPLSTDENIETLKRSGLPTIVTEGSDDYIFYRRLEETLKDVGVSLFPVGGKDIALNIFFRRKEIGRNNVMFLIDKDLWVFSGVPRDVLHRKVITSDGYSIENDLFRDGELESLLLSAERSTFANELDCIICWYSFCVLKLLRWENATIRTHPNQVLDKTGNLSQSYLASIGYTSPPQQIYDDVKGNYVMLLRGKTLLQLLARQLCKPGRQVKYGYHQLMEMGAARKGTNYSRIAGQAEKFFRPSPAGAN